MSTAGGSWPVLRPLTRGLRASFALGLIFLGNSGCGRSRISGTYIAHGPDLVEMLQLTQTDNGQITGVFNTIRVNAQGKLNSGQGSVNGVVDKDQLTLSVHALMLGSSFAGVIRGSKIQLQILGSDGSVASETFKRGSESDFKNYADELKHDADVIALSKNLGRRSQELRDAVQNAEKWISYAELHAQRIPGVKDHYRKLEDQMQSLVNHERLTSNSVARTQMSVNVIQGSVAGDQTDIEVNQMWDQTIGNSGRTLSRTFASLSPNCDSKELHKFGATSEDIATWQTACQQAQAERARFEVVFKSVMEQRAELKSFQAASESHRQALVDEASRIQ